MPPSFSIIIPAYNYGQTLERAVNSALEQQYSNFDILVIDDGSTDNTPSVTRQLLAGGKLQLRCLRQDNAGLAAVRNRGIREANGEWLIFLDADDELLKDALSTFADCIARTPESRMVIANHKSDNGKQRKTTRPPITSNDPEKNFYAYLWKKLSISNGACAMHRSLFQHVGYNENLRISEDTPVFATILANFRVTTTNTATTIIHKHTDSMRHNFDNAIKVGLSLENHIFDNNALPDWAQKYRKPYRAKRALSLMKLTAKQRQDDLTRHFYRIALTNAPQQALQPRYLKRLLISFLPSRQSSV